MEQELLKKLVSWIREHHFGKYRGLVTNNSDPTGRARLKVKVPAVLGDLELWAMPCSPYAGQGVGFVALPEAGSGVWVEFEGGDPSFPIWSGFFWADNELPSGAVAAKKIWQTQKLRLALEDDEDRFALENQAGSRVTLASGIVLDSGGASQSVDANGVVSQKDATKSEVTSSGFKVNDGALEVV